MTSVGHEETNSPRAYVVRSTSVTGTRHPDLAVTLRAMSGPSAPQQTACLLGGLPNLHNQGHSDCKGRTTTGLALDRDVTAHHLTEASAYNEAEAGPSVFASRR
jgi:hypothetical protein